MFRRTSTFAAIAAGMLGVLAALAPAQAANGRHAAMAIDANTGAVLLDEDGDAPRHPASLTKMMTLYMAFETIASGRLKMSDKLTISQQAADAAPSKLGLDAGEEISVRDAIKVLITKSANDIAIALAERVGGSEANFVKLMNARARDLGMTGTNFENASGLPDPDQITTARDMITLALALQDHYPEQYPLFATRSTTFRGKTFRNHNTMLNNFSGIDGIKTGYTRASGFNLVSSVRRGGRHVVAAVFGGASAATRNGEMRVVLTRSLTRAATRKTRKSTPLLIAKLKSQPKLAARQERKKPRATEFAAASAAVAPKVPQPFAPARPTEMASGNAAPSSLTTPDTFPRYVANAAVEAEPTPIKVYKVRRIEVLQRQAAPTPDPDQTTDMAANSAGDGAPDAIALALAADAAGNETNVPKAVAQRPASPLDAHIAMLGAADTIPATAEAPPAPQVEPVAAADAEPQPIVRGQPPSTLRAQAVALSGQGAPAATYEVASQSAAGSAGNFAIQIGAFGSLEEANKSLNAVQSSSRDLVGGHAKTTQVVSKDGRQLYRARFTGFDASSATTTCNALRQQSVDCFVLASQ